MRIQHTLTLIAAATLSLSAFAAPSAAVTAEAGDAAISSVHVVAGASFKLRPADLDGMQGSYSLSDGRTLHVSSAHRRLYADLGQARFELVPVAQNVFASRDDGMRLAFDRVPFATQVTLSSAADR